MTPEQITDIIRQTIFVAMQISAPLLLMAVIIGFFISVLMSVTQLNEITLLFVPKFFVFCITFAICFPWMLKILIKFTHEMLIAQWNELINLSQFTM